GAAVIGGEPDQGGEDAERIGRSIFELVRAYGVDGLTARAEDVGLEPVLGTLWVLDEIDGDAENEPFDGVDDQLLLFRIDEVYAE
ncbi:MAG: hypothetical protein M3P48_10960, partial [Actinomycetota bacterium]|nr:hypothetical protein [Actinomycetota bacterium]